VIRYAQSGLTRLSWFRTTTIFPLWLFCVSCALASGSGDTLWLLDLLHWLWVFLLEFLQQVCWGLVGLGIERLGPSFCLKWADNHRRLMLRSIFGSRVIALTAAFDYRAAAALRLPTALFFLCSEILLLSSFCIHQIFELSFSLVEDFLSDSLPSTPRNCRVK
jgi:hypothetical protein